MAQTRDLKSEIKDRKLQFIFNCQGVATLHSRGILCNETDKIIANDVIATKTSQDVTDTHYR